MWFGIVLITVVYGKLGVVWGRFEVVWGKVESTVQQYAENRIAIYCNMPNLYCGIMQYVLFV